MEPSRRHADRALPVASLTSADPNYPPGLATRFRDRSPAITALGNLGILQRKTVALICSVRCPGSLIIQAHDLAHALRDRGVTTIGGFHSPVEKECLQVLLRGRQPIVICPARALDGMRIPRELRPPIAAGRLLLLSPFDAKSRRATAALAWERNAFVAAIADAILVVHAKPGGATERFCREVLTSPTPLFTLDDSPNDGLIALGAQPVQPTTAPVILARAFADPATIPETSM